VHLLGQISGFAPEFTLSAKSPDLRPISPSRPNLRTCARVHPLDQISEFAPEFTLSAKSPDLRPSSPSRPNLRICARVQLLGQISGFAPEFTLSTKSPDLHPSSPSRPNLRICARVQLLGQISGFVPEFTLSAKPPDLRPNSPSRPNLRICARIHPLGQIPGFAPELTLGKSLTSQFPSSCSVGSTLAALQFPSSCSVGSTLATLQFPSSCSVRSTLATLQFPIGLENNSGCSVEEMVQPPIGEEVVSAEVERGLWRMAGPESAIVVMEQRRPNRGGRAKKVWQRLIRGGCYRRTGIAIIVGRGYRNPVIGSSACDKDRSNHCGGLRRTTWAHLRVLQVTVGSRARNPREWMVARGQVACPMVRRRRNVPPLEEEQQGRKGKADSEIGEQCLRLEGRSKSHLVPLRQATGAGVENVTFV
ncbi:hypothetical protein B296_00023138, partial [Ensete ventricosum]